MDQIIPLHSPSHANALARVRTSAFSTGQLLRSMFPVDGNPRLVEDWLFSRETLSLRDDMQSTFALVRGVREEDEEDEEAVGMDVCVEEEDVRYGDYHGGDQSVVGKRYVVLAFADWIRLPNPGGVNAEEHAEDKNEEMDGGGGAGAGAGGAETSLSPEAARQKKDLMFSSDYLPDGTNLVLNAAFRKGLVEGRRKYVDEERDCGMGFSFFFFLYLFFLFLFFSFLFFSFLFFSFFSFFFAS